MVEGSGLQFYEPLPSLVTTVLSCVSPSAISAHFHHRGPCTHPEGRSLRRQEWPLPFAPFEQDP